MWCHFWGVVIAFVLESTHKLRHHALIGGLALKPPLHSHQQAVTIVEKTPIGTEATEESAMVGSNFVDLQVEQRFVQSFRNGVKIMRIDREN